MFAKIAKEKDDEYITPILEQLNEENSFNMDKYTTAGKMLMNAFTDLKSEIKDGVSIVSLCEKYDERINTEVKDVFKHKSFDKGLAFPTCISVNNQAGYNSPLPENDYTLKTGDLVKVELGVQIDGFPVVVADTIMLGEPNEKQKKLLECLEEVKKNIKNYTKIGKNNRGVYEYLKGEVRGRELNLLACDERMEHCPGILSSQVSQGIIDGRNEKGQDFEKHEIIFTGRDSEVFDIDPFDFVHNQCFIVDVAISTGKGYVTQKDPSETTVYRKNPDMYYKLKLKASRQALDTLHKKSVEFPTSIRGINDTKFRLGLRECVENMVVEQYPVMYEKNDEYIANYKFTVIMRKGNKKVKNKNIYFN